MTPTAITPPGSPLARHPAFYPVAVFAAVALLLSVVAIRMPGDIDEGFYATAAELVFKGRVLYRDFFYPQAPLFPYALGAWMAVFGRTFVVARVFDALCTAGCATLIAHSVRRETGSRLAGAVGAALFATHELTWQWCTTIRPYALAELAMIGALVVINPPDAPPSWRRCLCAGALAAIAPGARLLLLPVVPAVALGAALRSVERGALVRGLAVMTIATLVTAVPRVAPVVFVLAGAISAVILLADRRGLEAALRAGSVLAGAGLVVGAIVVLFVRPAPAAFVFGNLGYHALRYAGGLIGTWSANEGIVASVFGGGAITEYSATGSQFLLLLTISAVGLFLPRADRRIAPCTAALLIAFASTKPNPIHEHYFTPMVPLLALTAATSLGYLWGLKLDLSRARRIGAMLAIVTMYIVAAGAGFGRRWVLAKYGDWSFGDYRAPTLDAAAAEVRAALATHPGDVLPAWPGSAVGVAERILPTFENDFGRNVAGSIPAEKRARLHLAAHRDFDDAIAARTPSVVVVDRRLEGADRTRIVAELATSRYTRWGRIIGVTEIFVRAP